MGWENTNLAFPTTDWTLIQAAHGASGGAQCSALINAYWPAVYAYLRHRGQRREAAAELTQAFFADVVLGRDLFAKADVSRGRLRSLLVTALINFERDTGRRERARGADGLRPLEAAWLEREDSLVSEGGQDPGTAFDRRWAMAQVEEALRRCQAHYVIGGKPGHWALFEARVLGPAMRGGAPVPLDALALSHGAAGPADVAAIVQVVKKRLGVLLREVLAETSAEGVDEELALCKQALGWAP